MFARQEKREGMTLNRLHENDNLEGRRSIISEACNPV